MSKNKTVGAKKKEIDWVRLDSYLQIGTSKKICCHLLECTPDNIERRIREKYDMTFTEYADFRLAKLKLKLIQTAVQRAVERSDTMLIFCLKNLCNWSDKVEHGVDEQIRTVALSYRLESDNEKKIKDVTQKEVKKD